MKKKEDIQDYELRIVGLSRSGNHGIINWIINQLQGNYLFLNCTEPKYNPYFTSRALGTGDETYQTNIPDFDLTREQKGDFFRKKYLLYNHEDCFLGSLNRKEEKLKKEDWIGPSKVQKDILILRDPFNLFASRIRAGLLNGHYTHHGAKPISGKILKRLYKQHAREFLGKKRNLHNKITVNFLSWTTDAAYRRGIAEKLEIPFLDKGFREVPKVAGGSSFDGTKFSGKTHEMKLHERWRHYAKDEDFWSLFDEELVELTAEIFGSLPAVEYYHKEVLGRVV